MKKHFFVISSIIVLSASSLVFANNHSKIISRAVDNYITALNHSNTGVVESAIMNIMKLKTEYPELDFTKLTEKLETTSLKTVNPVTKRKAYIASVYLRHPERFNWINKGTYEENNAFFELLALRIEMQEQSLRTKLAASDSTR